MAAETDDEGYATRDAFVAEQGARVTLPVYVAPTTDAQANTLRPHVSAIGCWRLNEALFDFDSSFVKPSVRESTPRFAALVQSNAGALASVFGHADPAGQDEYNKKLSGRRAASVFGLLTRDTALWQTLYDEPLGDDRWGMRAVQTMLGELTDPDAVPSAPYFGGAITGTLDAATRAAIVNFQRDQGLAPDGIVGPKTCEKLFRAYMDAVCVDAAGAPFAMDLSQFVGGGKGPNGKGDYQGCGEFNPVFLVSKAEQLAYDSGLEPASKRDARNAPNRRAMVFLFRALPEVVRDAWPCPTAKDPSSGCRTMFWPDGDKRRANGPAPREYRDDLRTMACSWYDRFARVSPCEGRVYTRVAVTLRDRFARTLEGVSYRMTVGDRVKAGRTADGVAAIVVPGVPDRCLVEWSPDPDDELLAPGAKGAYRLDLYVNHHSGTDTEQARKRLHNIGYPDRYPLDVATRAFQRDHGLPQTGALDAATRAALTEAHGSLSSPAQGPEKDDGTHG